MTVNDGVAALTVGNVYTPTTTGVVDNTAQYWPQWNVTYGSPLSYCSGDTHVFGCEHAEKCKCGIASRKVAPKKCATCGK